jgi:hypothetical protein
MAELKQALYNSTSKSVFDDTKPSSRAERQLMQNEVIGVRWHKRNAMLQNMVAMMGV